MLGVSYMSPASRRRAARKMRPAGVWRCGSEACQGAENRPLRGVASAAVARPAPPCRGSRSRAPASCSAPSPPARGSSSAPTPSGGRAMRGGRRGRLPGCGLVVAVVSIEPFEVLHYPVRVVDHVVSVHEDRYPSLPGQLLDLGPVAFQERNPDLVEVHLHRPHPASHLATSADQIGGCSAPIER